MYPVAYNQVDPITDNNKMTMHSFLYFAASRMTSFHISEIRERNRHWMLKKYDSIATFLEENRQNVFYLFVFYVITIALFCERFIRKYPPGIGDWDLYITSGKGLTAMI